MKKPNIGRINIVPTSSAENVREFYRRQGEQREQERIIKLLEELRAVGDDTLTGLYLDTTSLIAVIKGEK